jgi:TPR repeat protein
MAMGCDHIMVRLITCCIFLVACSCSNDAADRMPNYMQEWDGTYPDVAQVDMPPVNELPRLKALAYSGSVPAALSVMLFYINDDDDEKMQCYWASIAAQNGGTIGIYNLATCYETESFASHSMIRAKFWYQKGALLGDENSRRRNQALLGIRIDPNAIDVGSRPKLWNLTRYEDAAYSGSSAAAIQLARYYKDKDKSCYWYSIAAENGGKEAREDLSKCYADKSSWRFSPHRAKFWSNASRKCR